HDCCGHPLCVLESSVVLADRPDSSSLAQEPVSAQQQPDRRLLLGGHLTRIHGETFNPDVDRMYSAAHPPTNVAAPAVRLLLGGTAATVQGEPYDWAGPHMFSATYSPNRFLPPQPLVGALDSGAFSDPPHKRLTPEGALE